MLTNISAVMRRLIVTGAVLFLATAHATQAQTVVNAPATGVTLTPNLPSPQLAGTTITFTATGAGSSGYDYRFWVKPPGGTAYTVAQNYGLGPTYTLTAFAGPCLYG